MQNQENRRGAINFAELETGGLRVECPRCHVPFTPHLGILIAARFPCKNCKVSLSYRSSTGRTVRCPCCSSWRPMPSLKTLVCGGCDATVIYQKGDQSVKCYRCKHITHPQEANGGVSPFYQIVPPQVNRVVPPQVNLVVPPQTNRVVPPQVNRVIPPQTSRVVPPQVNLVAPPQVNRVIPPQINRRNRTANAETESTATSSFTPNPESTRALVADCVARLVRDCAPGNRPNKREVEEDKKEAKNKKIRTLID